MNGRGNACSLRTLQEESGQVLPWVALLMVLFLGMGGLTIDLGQAYVAYRELQASTDAAALSGAYALTLPTATTATVKAAAAAYSSVGSGANANMNLPNATIATTPECSSFVTNLGIGCTASSTGDNALVVVQQAVIPTHFIRILSVFGVNSAKSLTLTAVSTAGLTGTAKQYNVAIVLDTTASMASSDSDASCNSTRIACALSGVQTLLKSLTPCTATSTATSCTSFDTVSLFTFPPVQANTASNDTTCPTSNPTIVPYTTPVPGSAWSAPTGKTGTYQISSYLNNYSSTNQSGGALNTSSALTIATGSGGCKGLQTPGGDGTYFAGAIYAAISSLAYQQSLNTNSLNALVILSDGDASSSKITASNGETLTTTGKYPSLIDQCQQAVTAAQSAPSNTTVYSIAYGASSSGCSTDVPNISPCTTMQEMATTASDFFSDATAAQNKGQCLSSANPSLTLDQIFQHVAIQFSSSRLIPNGS
jgi:Flp pilus assembly protein TadG